MKALQLNRVTKAQQLKMLFGDKLVPPTHLWKCTRLKASEEETPAAHMVPLEVLLFRFFFVAC